ncbi:hypothetical protein PsorP6_011665 [Peronosclerospora sorghi]|uniref:Uncharacterized protein n=1 Tax=Peronosclerospora sorghi TaxID=230839 RepID=A0ACC0WHZ3_9STRA|nr:hypothetical protein PsorP6_011665 [Peronosclerospora sorghi]
MTTEMSRPPDGGGGPMNDHCPHDHALPTDAEDAAQRGGAEAEPAAGSNKAMGVSGATPVKPGAAQATSGGGAAGPSTSSYKDAVRKGVEQQSPNDRSAAACR